MLIAALLVLTVGITLYLLGLRLATPEGRKAYLQAARPSTILMLVVVGIALMIATRSPRLWWLITVAFVGASLSGFLFSARRSRLSGRALQMMTVGQLLSASGVVIVTFAAAQRAL
jgi:hypothetical protein